MSDSSDNIFSYDWIIPKGIYTFPGNYTIRISMKNGKYLKVGDENIVKWNATLPKADSCLFLYYRGFIKFDVSNFKKNKIIKKAVLHLQIVKGYFRKGELGFISPPPGGQWAVCSSGLHQIVEPWNHTFEALIEKIDEIQNTYDITVITRDWIYKNENYGLMLDGSNHTTALTGVACIAFYSCYLEITTLENELWYPVEANLS